MQLVDAAGELVRVERVVSPTAQSDEIKQAAALQYRQSLERTAARNERIAATARAAKDAVAAAAAGAPTPSPSPSPPPASNLTPPPIALSRKQMAELAAQSESQRARDRSEMAKKVEEEARARSEKLERMRAEERAKRKALAEQADATPGWQASSWD